MNGSVICVLTRLCCQISDYVFHRDLLDDTYYDENAHIQENTCQPTSRYTLCSKIYQAPATIMKLIKTRPYCHDLDALIKVYIEEKIRQRPTNERERAWAYDCTKVCMTCSDQWLAIC